MALYLWLTTILTNLPIYSSVGINYHYYKTMYSEMAILENDKFKNSGKSSKKKNCGHWNDNKNDKFLNSRKN